MLLSTLSYSFKDLLLVIFLSKLSNDVWNYSPKFEISITTDRPVESCKILGVLLNFGAGYSYKLEILGVLNATLFLISKIIGCSIAPPAPPLPSTLLISTSQERPSNNYFVFIAILKISLSFFTRILLASNLKR